MDAYSSGRLPGDVQATASATVDGNPATAWQPGLGTKAQVGSTLTYDLAKPQTLSGLALQVIADGRHSVPDRHDDHLGHPGAHRHAAADRRRHRARARSRRCRSPSPP